MPKTILQRLDDVIRWTGFPKRVEADLRRGKGAPPLRRSRWLPLVLLVIVSGLVVRYATNPALFAAFDPAEIVIRTITALFPCLVTASTFFGPLNPRRGSEQADEWEEALGHRALFFSAIVVGGLELAGVPVLIAIAFIHNWSSQTILVEIGLWLLYLFMLFQLAATLHASWSMPAATNRDEEVGLG